MQNTNNNYENKMNISKNYYDKNNIKNIIKKQNKNITVDQKLQDKNFETDNKLIT